MRNQSAAQMEMASGVGVRRYADQSSCTPALTVPASTAVSPDFMSGPLRWWRSPPGSTGVLQLGFSRGLDPPEHDVECGVIHELDAATDDERRS